MARFIVIQDGWIPEPFDTVEEAKAYKDRLELDATKDQVTTRIGVYKIVG